MPIKFISCDLNAVILATPESFSIFKVVSLEKIIPVFHKFEREVRMVGWSHEIQRVIYVGYNNRLIKAQTKSNSNVDTQSYNTPILDFKFNHTYLVVAETNNIILHETLNLSKLIELRTAHKTPLIAISNNWKINPFFIYTMEGDIGKIGIYNTAYQKSTGHLTVHETPIVAMAASENSVKLACACQGGFIRVFTISGDVLHEFQRSFLNFDSVKSLSFSRKGEYLVCPTLRNVIEIYNIDGETILNSLIPQETNSSWFSALTSKVADIGNQMVNMINPSHATLKLEDNVIKYECCMYRLNEYNYVTFLTEDGLIHFVQIDKDNQFPRRHSTNLIPRVRQPRPLSITESFEFVENDYSELATGNSI